MKTRSNSLARSPRPGARIRALAAVLFAALPVACGGSAPPADAPRAAAPTPPPAAAPTSAPTIAPTAVPATPPPPVSEPARLTLLVSNEQVGELEPCGCADGQYGGLPRRASLLKALRARGRQVLHADNGDLVLDGGLQSQQKFEATLQAHQAMGTVALTLGEMDLLLDPQTVYLTALSYGTPYVSVNVKPCDLTHVVISVETAGGVIRVGLTGFLDPELVTEAAPGWQVQAPQPGLAVALAELSRSADVIVVLAHATAARAQEILRDLPAPHVLVVAHETDDPLEPVPQILRGIRALAPGTQAKYLARIDVTLDGGRVDVDAGYRGLDEKIPDLAAVRALLDNYQAILKQLNLAELTPRVAPPYEAGGNYVGPTVCAKCHVSAGEAWHEARHSHALDTLVAKNHEYDPDCLSCHTTGFPYEGGYASRKKTPELAWVSCESCHGPGSNHVAKPGPGYGSLDTPHFCLSCHDTPNSPDFDFDTYWPQITHSLDWDASAS